MKFGNLLYDIIFESAIKNKAKFNELVDKWRVIYPDMTEDQAVKIFTRHSNIKDQISMDQPGVVTFLARYDGIPQGTKKYELKDLRDIYQFQVNHLVEFLREFGNFSIDLEDESTENNSESSLKKIFSEKDEQKTDKKIEESKKMWYNESTALINENGFRVYDIKNQTDIIRMGYYYQEIFTQKAKKDFIESRQRYNPPWCVTGRGSKVAEYVEYEENGTPQKQLLHTQYSNQYVNYRQNQNRSFYFIIDENRSQDDKYYMSALQIDKYGSFLLTSMMNDGDTSMSWDGIISIYPQLTQHKNKIAYRQLTNEEIETKNVTNVINEDEGNLNDFCRQTQDRKQEFINLGGILKKPRSWSCMGQDLRRLYISTMDTANAFTKFSNMEFLTYVLNTPGGANSLERRLNDLGKPGVSYLVDHLMNYEFKIARRSLDNNNFTLYESTRTKKFGIFNPQKPGWVEKNGVTYGPTYSLISFEIYRDIDTNQKCMVEIYSQQSSVGDSSFFCIYPTASSNAKKNGHFLSFSAWSRLKESGKIKKENEMKKSGDMSNFDPESDVDLKEIKKGI